MSQFTAHSPFQKPSRPDFPCGGISLQLLLTSFQSVPSLNLNMPTIPFSCLHACLHVYLNAQSCSRILSFSNNYRSQLAYKKANRLFSVADKPQLSVTSTEGIELRCGSQMGCRVCRWQPGRTDSPRLRRLQTGISGCFSGQRPELPISLVAQISPLSLSTAL